MLETDAAWAAGLIDGEGSISINKAGRSYALCLAVQMTDEPTITRLHGMFKAGNVCYREPEKAHYKPVWMWRVHGREVACVLAIIHRYLFTKKEAAEIALEYFELAWTDRKDKQRLSDSVLALRESFSKRLKLTY